MTTAGADLKTEGTRAVPKRQTIIARRFNAGIARSVHESRQGRLKFRPFSRPSGTREFSAPAPGVETPGYSQSSLRDATCPQPGGSWRLTGGWNAATNSTPSPPPQVEERAGERRRSSSPLRPCSENPLSPALSPLVPRKEREWDAGGITSFEPYSLSPRLKLACLLRAQT